MIWPVPLLSWQSLLVDFCVFEKFVIAVAGLYWQLMLLMLLPSPPLPFAAHCHQCFHFSVASFTCYWVLAKSNIDVVATGPPVDCCFFHRSFVRLLLQLWCCCQCSSLFATQCCSLTKPCCLHCAALCWLLGLIGCCLFSTCHHHCCHHLLLSLSSFLFFLALKIEHHHFHKVYIGPSTRYYHLYSWVVPTTTLHTLE